MHVAGRNKYPTAAAFVQPGDQEDRQGKPFVGPAGQVAACRPWLDAEFSRLSPRVVVTLGATAGQALFGATFRIGTARGQTLGWASGPDRDELTVVPTVHPSSIIRMQGDDREAAYAAFVQDLRTAAGLLHQG